VIKAVNLGVRFLLELTALAALGLWGWRVAPNPATGFALALLVPLAAAVYWGLLISPKARWRVRDPGRAVLELGLWLPAAFALAAVGHPLLAAAFAAVTAANVALLFAWEQRGTA
jgi:hypothetical protein